MFLLNQIAFRWKYNFWLRCYSLYADAHWNCVPNTNHDDYIGFSEHGLVYGSLYITFRSNVPRYEQSGKRKSLDSEGDSVESEADRSNEIS